MAYTIENNYTGNGTTRLYSFTFPYLEDTDVKVSLNQVDTTNFEFANATQINFTADAGGATSTQEASGAPKSSVAIRVYRDTNIDNLQGEFFSGSAIRAQDLNNDFNQTLYVSQETQDKVEDMWNNTTDTLDSTEAFADVNTQIMTAAAIDDRINVNIAAQALADGRIWVGNGSGVGAQVTPSGDVTMANTGAFTIASTAVETGMIANDAVTAAKVADGAIDAADKLGTGVVGSTKILDNAIIPAKINADAVTTDKILNENVTTAKIANLNVTTGKIANDAVTGAKIADDAVTSAKIADGHVGTNQLADGEVTTAKLADSAVTKVKIAADAVGTTELIDGEITAAKMAANSIDSQQYVDGSIDHEHLANDIIDSDNIQDDAISSEHLVDYGIINRHIANDAAIAHSKLAAVPDGQIIVGNGSTVPTAVAVSGDVTIANTGAVTIAADAVEIGMIGCEQTTITDSDSHVPTSGAVVDYVTSIVAPIGGLEVIADDESFPNTIPAAGVVISITDCAGLSVNSSGVSTNGDALDNSTITINGFPTELRGGATVGGVTNADPYVFGSGAGLMVQSTGSSHTYNYHQALIREADFVRLSGDIDDFNQRYRVTASASGVRTGVCGADGTGSGSYPCDGDMAWFTGANKMYVFDAPAASTGNSDLDAAWSEVSSVGDYKILTVKDNGEAVGGAGPTFNGTDKVNDIITYLYKVRFSYHCLMVIISLT